jgi:hypothetical protein
MKRDRGVGTEIWRENTDPSFVQKKTRVSQFFGTRVRRLQDLAVLLVQKVVLPVGFHLCCTAARSSVTALYRASCILLKHFSVIQFACMLCTDGDQYPK